MIISAFYIDYWPFQTPLYQYRHWPQKIHIGRALFELIIISCNLSVWKKTIVLFMEFSDILNYTKWFKVHTLYYGKRCAGLLLSAFVCTDHKRSISTVGAMPVNNILSEVQHSTCSCTEGVCARAHLSDVLVGSYGQKEKKK